MRNLDGWWWFTGCTSLRVVVSPCRHDIYVDTAKSKTDTLWCKRRMSFFFFFNSIKSIYFWPLLLLRYGADCLRIHLSLVPILIFIFCLLSVLNLLFFPLFYFASKFKVQQFKKKKKVTSRILSFYLFIFNRIIL